MLLSGAEYVGHCSHATTALRVFYFEKTGIIHPILCAPADRSIFAARKNWREVIHINQLNYCLDSFLQSPASGYDLPDFFSENCQRLHQVTDVLREGAGKQNRSSLSHDRIRLARAYLCYRFIIKGCGGFEERRGGCKTVVIFKLLAFEDGGAPTLVSEIKRTRRLKGILRVKSIIK